MTFRHLPRTLGAAAVAAGAIFASTPAAPAQAAPCPDVQLVFARGTGEAPGVGGIGQSYVDALRAALGPRTLDVYAVNYAASNDFNNREEIARTVIDGVRDAQARVESSAANCPNTKVVLGGYSQGALVAGYATADRVPAGVPVAAAPSPLSARAADHVAAVTLFGTPSTEFLQFYNAPLLTIGPNFTAKTLELCAQGDTICDGAPGGQPSFAHTTYGFNGMTNEAAQYAVDRIAPAPVPR